MQSCPNKNNENNKKNKEEINNLIKNINEKNKEI